MIRNLLPREKVEYNKGITATNGIKNNIGLFETAIVKMARNGIRWKNSNRGKANNKVNKEKIMAFLFLVKNKEIKNAKTTSDCFTVGQSKSPFLGNKKTNFTPQFRKSNRILFTIK